MKRENLERVEESAAPKRIQRKRIKGWKMPPNTVYVGRPTIYGNFYRVGRPLGIPGNCETPQEAVELFRVSLKNAIRNGWDVALKLRGKDLACWCPLLDKDGNPVPCHADVLLEIANAPLP